MLLWISIFGFTALVPGLLASFNRSKNSRLKFDRLYSLILLVFCIWLIINSFLFFQSSFIKELSLFWNIFFTLTRAVVTAAVMFIYGRITGPVLNPDKKIITGSYKFIPIIYIVSVLIFIAIENSSLASLITIAVSLYMVCLSVTGFFSAGIKADPNYRLFFIITASYNLFLLIYAVSRFYIPGRPVPESLSRSIYSFFLGMNEIIRMFASKSGDEEAVSPVFLDYYNLTPREKEVMELIQRDFPVSRVADKLFISKRTVETHLYNIYSKCNVRNRIELIDLMKRFSLRNNT